MRYLRKVFGVQRMNGRNTEYMYNRFMSNKGEGMRLEAVKEINCSILKWFNHKERKAECKMTKRISTNKIDVLSAGGQHHVNSKDGVQEYAREKGKRNEICKARNKF